MYSFMLILPLLFSLHAGQDPIAVQVGALFRAANVEGTFLLYDLHKGVFAGYRSDRWDSAYIPASTFKIFNSLVALETGVIKDEQTVLPWDSTVYQVKEWNHNHAMTSAFKASAVWFYQELARRIGPERMQHYLDTVGYGNRTMGGPIDLFWLGGGLRITPREQIAFLVRLHNDALPFTKETMRRVKAIMVAEQQPEYTLRAKTGRSDATDPETAWYVGYVERSDGVYFFATELDIRKEEDAAKRVTLSRRILKELGIID
jgi:beta-lactamase class D